MTVLVSDVEDSSRQWVAAADDMAEAAREHAAILSAAITRAGGSEAPQPVAPGAVAACFAQPMDALAAALDAERGLRAWSRSSDLALRARIAVDTREAPAGQRDVDLDAAVARCARLCAVANGGQVLVSAATHDLVADRLTARVGLTDMGVHRLPDLGRPEHVYALTHAGIQSDLEPLRSLDATLNNLPYGLTSLVGRERELIELRAELAQTRLLTLTGAGGCGKTRLALQAAADALDRFPDGVWWVELASHHERAEIGQTLARAIGVRPLAGETAVDAAVRRLAPARALVVLDNPEHVLDAVAKTASALLQRCSDVTVLVTSRVPLGRPDETTWRVPSLSVPDSVRLFAERARKVRPGFTVDDEAAPKLAQLCAELDGIPLAIELAAARLRLMTVEQIAAGLSDRFRLLAGGPRTALPRHRTLRASVEWSHALLDGDERALLRRLAVFAGGFALDAVEGVAADGGNESPPLIDVLAGLVDKSLVVAEEHGAEARYRLLDTVREYALERLDEAGEADAVRDRHLDFFLARAQEAGPEVSGARVRERLAELDLEAGNLAAAVDGAPYGGPRRCWTS